MKSNPLPSKFRIRGFSDASAKPDLNITPARTLDPAASLNRIFRMIGRPHLTDLVFHTKLLPRLSALWPTHHGFRPRLRIRSLKSTPLHLYDYIDIRTDDPEALEIIRVNERQQFDETSLADVVWNVEHPGDQIVWGSPIAMAIACALRRGDHWLRQNKTAILEVILHSPFASHLALCSGFFQQEANALLDRIVEDPGLVVDVVQNPALYAFVPDGWGGACLNDHPVHKAALMILNGRHREASKLLHQSAESHAVSAGILLGLEPTSERASDWLSVAVDSPEALYFMGQVVKMGGTEVSSHPHAFVANIKIQRDFRWYYLWLRDVMPEEAGSSLQNLWPSPWAVELAVDLGLPPSTVLDCYNNRTPDTTETLGTAALLWAADYVGPEVE